MRALERGELRGSLAQVLWALGKRPRSEAELRARFPAAVPALARLERLGLVSRAAAGLRSVRSTSLFVPATG
jgi:hypothetical protein